MLFLFYRDDEGTADEEEEEDEDDVSEEEEEEVGGGSNHGDETSEKVIVETTEENVVPEFVIPRPVQPPFASYSSVSEEDDKSEHGSGDEAVANGSLDKNLKVDISSLDNEVSALLDKMGSLKIGFNRDQEGSNTSNANGPSESQ